MHNAIVRIDIKVRTKLLTLSQLLKFNRIPVMALEFLRIQNKR